MQHWHETDLTRPVITGHHRSYTWHDVLEVALISELKRKSVKLRHIRWVIKALRREPDWQKALLRGAHLLVTVGDAEIYVAPDSTAVLRVMEGVTHPVVLVRLTQEARTAFEAYRWATSHL